MTDNTLAYTLISLYIFATFFLVYGLLCKKTSIIAMLLGLPYSLLNAFLGYYAYVETKSINQTLWAAAATTLGLYVVFRHIWKIGKQIKKSG